MFRRDPRFGLLVALTVAAIVGVLVCLVVEIGRPYPGFFFSSDFRVFPATLSARAAGLEYGDRIVAVDGRSPISLMARVEAARGPIRYEVERAGRRFSLELVPATFTRGLFVGHFAAYFAVSAVMLAVGLFVFAQNPAALPNRNFLVYMCLWAVSNVAVPEAVLGPRKYAAILVSFVPPLLSVHGWVFFLTYPVNPARQAWLAQHRVIPRLYRAALAVGLLSSLVFVAVYAAAPGLLVDGWLYPAAVGFPFALAAVSFPIKIWALVDTRRRARSPLVDQQTSVLMLGIGLGLGCWLTFMLAPLLHYYDSPMDPQVGSVLVLLYPLAIGYATVRYRLFDATVVIRRSVVYTMLAGLITGAYALLLAGANALVAQADWTRSPWFSGAFMFGVVLLFNPLREWVRRAVDRTFFRERYDYARTIQALARSMASLLDLDEITRRLTTTIESAMHVRSARLLLGGLPADIVAVLQVAPGALSRYQLAADPRFARDSAPALAAYAVLDAEVIVPLRFQDALEALLVLGPKRSEAAYTDDDLELLETVADQAAVAVANAEAHRRVLDYARELERSLMIRTNLAKFVPQRVRQLIEESPEAPSLDKRETDVTVLFADITGYTRLTARLAPGRSRRARRALLRRLPRRDRQARRRRQRDGGRRAHGHLPRGRPRPGRGGGGAGHPPARRRDRRRARGALRAARDARRDQYRPRAARRHQDRRARGHALDLYRLGHDHQPRRAPGRPGGGRRSPAQREHARALSPTGCPSTTWGRARSRTSTAPCGCSGSAEERPRAGRSYDQSGRCAAAARPGRSALTHCVEGHIKDATASRSRARALAPSCDLRIRS